MDPWIARLCDRVCECVLEALLAQDVESRAQLDACAKLGMVHNPLMRGDGDGPWKLDHDPLALEIYWWY